MPFLPVELGRAFAGRRRFGVAPVRLQHVPEAEERVRLQDRPVGGRGDRDRAPREVVCAIRKQSRERGAPPDL